MIEPTVSLRNGESLADYAIRLTRERDEARHDAAQAHGVAQALERQVLSQQEACATASLAVAALVRERDEALGEVYRLRALLRECLPLVEAQQLAAPPGDTLVARLTAALEE